MECIGVNVGLLLSRIAMALNPGAGLCPTWYNFTSDGPGTTSSCTGASAAVQAGSTCWQGPCTLPILHISFDASHFYVAELCFRF